MKKLPSTLPAMLLSLTLISLCAGVILATANYYTATPIALAKTAALVSAVKEVTPPFDNDPVADKYHAVTGDGDSLLLYPATKDGQPVGVAVESNSKKGFGGEIRVIVGFDTEGKVVNYVVLQHAETPGLGSKMQDWFRTDKNRQSIIGRKLDKGELIVAKDGGDVDAITASTITSRAFLNSINRAYSALQGTDATTSASPAADGNTQPDDNASHPPKATDSQHPPKANNQEGGAQ